MKSTTLLFAAFASVAVAQRGSYDPYGGGNDDYYQDYAGGQGDDNLYADYAAKQNDKAMGRGGGGAVGWAKLLAVGFGGYLVGAKMEKHKLQKDLPRLRFKKKQRVECKIGPNEWARGTVTKLWFEQSQGQYMPYQVRLDSGQMIYAPQDNQMIIRAVKNAKKKK